ncbi:MULTISPECIES: glycosyl hydrolase 108 family protein [unclassified Sphingopyxis]|uniref:glycoside hydrolase family 108 protein n=1 Tax=unclassified Sphingopyxis TaxID=2614943 RepID=UPI002860BF53|nr:MULTISPECIES: glycosyl hydrolase 108 family protein [unclassified Sphingopyxis]MDR7062004.1 lysozyme family protein [Sphingopyxis sp. BE235]MDR7182462.1 lysozyme family protein [Sphingopyxis sp. BE249]
MTNQPKPNNGAVKKGGLATAIALILAAVFSVEGGYVNDPRDPGGETNHGVTKQVARANGFDGPMRDLTKVQAGDIYTKQYIEKPGFVPVIDLSPAVGHELVDSGVNAGPGRAARWFQETLNHLNNGGRDYADIAEDGQVGPGTVAAFRSLKAKRGAELSCVLVLRLLDAKQAGHYMRLAANDNKFEAFMVGWTRTRVENVERTECAA